MPFCARYRSLHPRTIPSYFQFMIVLLLPLNIFLFPFLPAVLSLDEEDLKGGGCRDRCSERRPDGLVGAFEFACDKEYTTDGEKSTCRQSCETCPKEVCDETIDANIWTCPPRRVPQECRDFCNSKRPKGNKFPYTLNCDGSDCESQCNKCPDYICDVNKDALLFHCPKDSVRTDCDKQCDKARELGQVDAFTFKCHEKYSDDYYDADDKKECEQTCRDKCPPYLCQKSDNDEHVFTCPVASISDKCKKDVCDKQRPVGNTGTFIYKCKDDTDSYTYSQKCRDECHNCAPSDVESNYICKSPGGWGSERNSKIHCPIFDPEPTLEAKPSYKGVCKEACERNRGGGLLDYELHCEHRYKTSQEQARCRKICAQCSGEVCSGNVIECRGDPEEVAKEQEKEKAEKENREKQLKDEKEITRREVNEAQEDSTAVTSRKSGWIIAFVVLTLLLLIATITGCCLIKSSNEKDIEKAHMMLQQNQSMARQTALQQQRSQLSGVDVGQQQQLPSVSQAQMQPPLDANSQPAQTNAT